MIDTHTHLYLDEFASGASPVGLEAVERAIASGVSHMVMPNVDASTIVPMKVLHSHCPDCTSMAMGLHPTEVKPGWERIVEEMAEMLSSGGFVAVGEVGMDLYWDKSFRSEQIEAFTRQLRMADKLSLPVIIHCREALADTIRAISDAKPAVPLIFHSFTGTPEDVASIRNVCDPMFGINGVVTFKNAGALREALPSIGIDRILLETDAPYLAPVPHRGRRNESSFLPNVRDMIAATLSLPPQEVEEATDRNARNTFNI